MLCAVGVLLCEKRDPVQRPVYVFDTTIANAHLPNTIDDFLAPLIPAIVFIMSLVLVEVYLFRRGRVATAAAVVRFFLAAWAALMVVGFFTELFKVICGRLRPDFLDRCKPAVTVQQGFAAFGSGTPREFGEVGFDPKCTEKDARALRDGRVSFPSGHSSTSYVVGWFGCFYLLWGATVRSGMELNRRLYVPGDGFWRRLGKEAMSALLMALMLFQLAYPWGVGVSRFRDNRHNASDIIAGFMLGLTFAAYFLVRAIGQHEWWAHYYPNIDGVGNDLFPKPSGLVPVGGGGGGAGAAANGGAAGSAAAPIAA